jgi:hypothetical protein
VFFCKYLPEEFPGVESLENFYEIMLAPDDAPLPKVIGNSACWGPEGCLEGKLLDFKIHHPDNPPIFALAEYAHALQTGDKARLEKVYLEKRWLQRWYEMFDAFDPAAPQPHGTAEKVRIKKCADGYHWAGWPSGMDNSPRGKTGPKAECDPDLCPDNPDLLWLDALAQQGLSALCLARIAELLGRTDEAAAWRAKWRIIYAKRVILRGDCYTPHYNLRIPDYATKARWVLDARSAFLAENMTPEQKAYARDLAIERRAAK